MASRQSSTLRSRGAYLALEESASSTTMVDFSSRVMDFNIENSKMTSDDTTMGDTDKKSSNQLNDRTASLTFDGTATNLDYVQKWDKNDDFEPLFQYGTDGNAAGKPKQDGQLSLISFSQTAAVGQPQSITAQCQVHDYDTGTF